MSGWKHHTASGAYSFDLDPGIYLSHRPDGQVGLYITAVDGAVHTHVNVLLHPDMRTALIEALTTTPEEGES